MMEFLVVAFSLGFFGSLHCVGMCGPIAMAIPVHGRGLGFRILGIYLYNSGRIFTYGILGAVLGTLGLGMKLAGYQQVLSITLGVLLLLGLILPRILSINNSLLLKFNMKLKGWFASWMKQKSPQALFITGLLNGLLPCGLIYVALAGATSSGETVKGALFMAVFGLGTLPAMFSVSFISSISKRFRLYLSHTAPVLTFVVGVMLVVRGLGLGIPYLSPVFKAPTKDTPAVIYCHKPQPQQVLTPAPDEH
jgi:sulfite exporter TauE/SafE